MGQSGSKPVRFRPAAIADLRDLWSFGADRWSAAQADRYLLEMVEAIDRLAENPNIVRERVEFSPAVRIYTFRAHIVVFRDADTHLDVIRTRYGHEDWATDPAGRG